jgi:ribonuclease HI
MISLDQHISTVWDGTSISACFDHWTTRERSYKLLPPLVSWFIWLVRNNKIFENRPPSVCTVAYKTLGMYKNWKAIHPFKLVKQIKFRPHISEDTPTGWFDGATQHSGTLSGAGGLIRITKDSIYRWTFCCGPGTNTRARTIGCLGTLHLASRLNIEVLQMLGDSRIIIEWLNNKGKLQAISLLAWKDRIRLLQHHFKKLNFTHIYREYNKEAYLLSKATLQKKAGMITYNHWLDGHEGPTHTIKIY